MDLETSDRIRILLIDDDEDDYFIIKKIINQIPRSPFVIEWAASYEAGLERIEAREHDAYLLDYRLGEKTGLDLLRKVKPQDRSEPFILLTGAGDRDIERRSMRLAAADYLVKGSFNADLLSRTIYYALQRKEIEQQRLQHLVDLNRSKDEFISIASHQLRTPATGVKQYIGMLLEGFVGELDERQRQMLEKAYESNERQLQIVSDLLKVAQVDAGKVKIKRSTVALNEFISDIIREQLDTFASRNQIIHFTTQSQGINAEIDRDLVRMVLENIIDNASKYSEQGCTVEVGLRKQGKSIAITVRDEGVGIPPSEQARLFEKFSRINNPLSMKVGGTGLGLYWAKKVIDLHQGDITVSSREGKGTVFTISFPKANVK